MTDVPQLEKPQELEEGDQSDDTAEVGHGSHDGSKVAAAAAGEGASEKRDEEEDQEEYGVEEYGPEGHDRES